MKKLAVIGHPIAHSKSPLIHNYWIKKYGLEARYEALDIPPDNLKEGLKKAVDQGFSGFNLTLPHKELALDICDDIDQTAKIIGAVNTIKIDKDGRSTGTNTDAAGFIESILEDHPDFDFSAGPATILGAGGAARAIAFGLVKAGVPKINLVNRTREKAETLAAQSSSPEKFQVSDWHEMPSALEDTNILVQTTSLGMMGKPPLKISLQNCPQSALVVDIVYNPLMTELLKSAKQNGNPYVTGIGMLLHQARLAFHIWFDIMPEIDDELRNKALTAL